MAKLTHGPIVGATNSNSVVIWARADEKAIFKVRLDSGISKTVTLNSESDFTGVVRFSRLQPDRAYTYSVSLGGEQVAGGEDYCFKTFPKSRSGDFSFAFGSCFVPDDYGDKIFQSLAEKADDWKLRFFLMLGDNVYVDHYVEHTRTKLGLKPADNMLQLYREAYRHSWEYKSFRRFLRRISTFMIFDDHEFWDNWGTRHSSQDAGDAYRVACQTYHEYQDSHNPDSLARHKEDPPQYYYTFEYGDVGFFVLDCRTRRSPRGLPYPSILGDEQREALYKWLRDKEKRYAVKFVVSSVPITFIAIPHWLINLLHDVLGDQWMGFRKARADLFKFIQDHNLTGVHFLSGDIHLGQGVKIEPRKAGAGPTVYSYTSSPFANNFWLVPPNPPKSALGVAGALFGFILSGFIWVSGLILSLSTWGGFGKALIFLGGWKGALILAVVGAVLAVRGERMKMGKTRVKPGWFGRFIVILFSRPIDALYNLWLRAVSGDKIQAHGVDYRPSNLFPYAREINVGVVHVRRKGDSAEVCFELYDEKGKLLRQEEPPHSV